jgi:hypothetical protein
MTQLRVEGSLRFASNKHLAQGLAAFEERRYVEFAEVGDFGREGLALSIAQTKDVESDCLPGFPKAYQALAQSAAGGFIELRGPAVASLVPDRAGNFIELTAPETTRLYAGGWRVRVRAGAAQQVAATQLGWREPGDLYDQTPAIETAELAPDGDLVAVCGGRPHAVGAGGKRGKGITAGVLKISSTEDWSPALFRLSTGAEQQRFFGPRWVCGGLAFDGPGARLAAASADEHIYVWEVASGQLLARRKAHKQGALRVGWSADGATLLSVGADATVATWQGAKFEEKGRTATIVGLDLTAHGATPAATSLTVTRPLVTRR